MRWNAHISNWEQQEQRIMFCCGGVLRQDMLQCTSFCGQKVLVPVSSGCFQFEAQMTWMHPGFWEQEETFPANICQDLLIILVILGFLDISQIDFTSTGPFVEPFGKSRVPAVSLIPRTGSTVIISRPQGQNNLMMPCNLPDRVCASVGFMSSDTSDTIWNHAELWKVIYYIVFFSVYCSTIINNSPIAYIVDYITLLLVISHDLPIICQSFQEVNLAKRIILWLLLYPHKLLCWFRWYVSSQFGQLNPSSHLNDAKLSHNQTYSPIGCTIIPQS